MKTFRSFIAETKGTYDIDDLNPVQYPAADSKFSRRNAKKRKRADVEHESVDPDLSDEELEENLTVAQRRKRSMAARRNKAKMQRGRRIARRRVADSSRLNRRSRRQARNDLIKIWTRGKDKSKMSAARKSQLEKRASRATSLVRRKQRRILPSVRKRDRGIK